LRNTGNGNFEVLSNLESGFYVPGDGKALIRLAMQNGKNLLVATQNNDRLKAFESADKSTLLAVHPNEVSAMITLRDGIQKRVEFHWGSGFMSQSQRVVQIFPGVQQIEFKNNQGKITRILNP
jgi:hypothetical protein